MPCTSSGLDPRGSTNPHRFWITCQGQRHDEAKAGAPPTPHLQLCSRRSWAPLCPPPPTVTISAFLGSLPARDLTPAPLSSPPTSGQTKHQENRPGSTAHTQARTRLCPLPPRGSYLLGSAPSPLSAQALPAVSFSFLLFRAAPVAYGASQARRRIRVTAASRHHSHSNAGSELHLRPTPQLMAAGSLTH